MQKQVREMVERLAASGSDPVLIGCRPDGSWFAHHAGVEVDGPPVGAVRALVEQRERTLAYERARAEREARQVAARLESLKGEG